MILNIKIRHLESSHNPKTIIKNALLEATNVYSRQIDVYSSFCILKTYGGMVLHTIHFPQKLQDFIKNYDLKTTHGPFSVTIGEIILCHGDKYKIDLFEEYQKELNLSAGIIDENEN